MLDELHLFLQSISSSIKEEEWRKHVIDSAINIIKKQTEQTKYFKHQADQMVQGFEEIIDLLHEDYYENWEDAIQVAERFKHYSIRLHKLETDNRIRTEINEEKREQKELAEQNRGYREALEFYADERNYEERDFGIIKQTAIQEGDKGNTARKALEGES